VTPGGGGGGPKRRDDAVAMEIASCRASRSKPRPLGGADVWGTVVLTDAALEVTVWRGDDVDRTDDVEEEDRRRSTSIHPVSSSPTSLPFNTLISILIM